MARNSQTIIHAAIKGTVFGLDRVTGAEVWNTPLKGSDFVNLALVGEDLFAATRGEIFCLDPASGTIRWNNPLRGFGFGLVTMAASDPSSVAALSEHLRQLSEAAAHANSAASTVTAPSAAMG